VGGGVVDVGCREWLLSRLVTVLLLREGWKHRFEETSSLNCRFARYDVREALASDA